MGKIYDYLCRWINSKILVDIKEATIKRTRKLFNFLDVFALWVVPFANLNTRLYFEIHLPRFKWGCYIEGVKIWD
jgi:hypothetical protein